MTVHERIYLNGQRHCCVCDRPCWHLGPIRRCHNHTPRWALELVPEHKIAEVNPE